MLATQLTLDDLTCEWQERLDSFRPMFASGWHRRQNVIAPIWRRISTA